MTTENSTVDAAILNQSQTQLGSSLAELSNQTPVLAVFLRHAGCPFCREALADVAARRTEIEAAGARVVLVHMMPEADAAPFFAKFGLADLPRISDPERRLYQAFSLSRGSLWAVAGPAAMLAGARVVLSGKGFGRPVGDVFQMPGTFLLYQGRIVSAFRPRSSSERADYVALAQCSTNCALDDPSI